MRVLAIGDIHCKAWIIDKVVEKIDDYDRVVFIGDYADNWGSEPIDSIETWRTMRALQAAYTDKVECLVGNHDFAYLIKSRVQSSGYNPITKLLIGAPENLHVKQWLATLPVMIYVDNVTYSHGGVDVNWNTSTDERFLWANDSPLWNRPGETVYGPEAQVFGHTPQSSCNEIYENIWCIDTFSTYHDGSPIGDQTVLEIIDGKIFNKISL